MNESGKANLAKAKSLLDEARTLVDKRNYGSSLKCAYEASDCMALAYVTCVSDNAVTQNEDGYEVFRRIVDKPVANDETASEIQKLVRIVGILREAYEPALLEETTKQDAEQMIDHVKVLQGLIEGILHS